jgi:hypothetical protein
VLVCAGRRGVEHRDGPNPETRSQPCQAIASLNDYSTVYQGCAVRPPESPTWSDAIEALRRIPEPEPDPPPVELPALGSYPQAIDRAQLAQQTEPERTPKQAAIWEFLREIWPEVKKKEDYPPTAKIHDRMEDSEVWRCIATKHGVSTAVPDWHTIHFTLGREVR